MRVQRVARNKGTNRTRRPCDTVAEKKHAFFLSSPIFFFRHPSTQDWVRATEALVEMGEAGLAPTSGSARKWRLATAAIEETELELDEDYMPGEDERGGTEEEDGGEEVGGGGRLSDDGASTRGGSEEREQDRRRE